MVPLEIVRETSFSAVTAAASLTRIRNVDAVTAVGVPAILPVLPDSVRPAGTDPDTRLHVYGDVPPLACSVCEYPTQTWPDGSGFVVAIVRGSGAPAVAVHVVWTGTKQPASSMMPEAVVGDVKVPVTVESPQLPEAFRKNLNVPSLLTGRGRKMVCVPGCDWPVTKLYVKSRTAGVESTVNVML
jgi:hypothetical protein